MSRLTVGQWPQPTAETERVFRRLADTWLADVGFASDKRTLVTHPSDLQIIGLGPQAVRLLLRERQRSPNHWLWALRAITREDPAAGLTDFH